MLFLLGHNLSWKKVIRVNENYIFVRDHVWMWYSVALGFVVLKLALELCSTSTTFHAFWIAPSLTLNVFFFFLSCPFPWRSDGGRGCKCSDSGTVYKEAHWVMDERPLKQMNSIPRHLIWKDIANLSCLSWKIVFLSSHGLHSLYVWYDLKKKVYYSKLSSWFINSHLFVVGLSLFLTFGFCYCLLIGWKGQWGALLFNNTITHV